MGHRSQLFQLCACCKPGNVKRTQTDSGICMRPARHCQKTSKCLARGRQQAVVAFGGSFFFARAKILAECSTIHSTPALLFFLFFAVVVVVVVVFCMWRLGRAH